MSLSSRPEFWRGFVRKVGRRLVRLAENNGDPHIESNGELWLLRQLLRAHRESGVERPFVAFDIGANTGAYTRRILDEAKQVGCACEVHVFEPSPRCLEGLRRTFAGETAVRLVGAAISDRAGDAMLFAGGTGTSLASLVERPMMANAQADGVRVPLMRLQDYAAKQRVARVDLVKLDVEGSELAALRGGGEWLRPENVDVIQFEYGGTTLDAGVTLKEIAAWLRARGFLLAKLLPRALDVREYAAWMENFEFANYVALAPRWRSGARR